MADIVIAKRLADPIRLPTSFLTRPAVGPVVNVILADWYGTHKITGTVYVVGPPQTPASKDVFLFDDRTGQCIAKTWSDATTGAYTFTKLNPALRYTVASWDKSGVYGAVIADNLTPTPP